LTSLIKTAAMTNKEPALYIIEDAHWIDEVSESMLADLLAVIPRTPSMVLITSRPEYEGALTRVHGAQTIVLGPLGDSDTAALLDELLGSDPSVGDVSAAITERSAGNPFFAEEMVRELAQRGVLAGERGNYICRADAADIAVPATVQAAIAARIDRLTAPAKRTVHAASVIGARFDAGLLAALGIDTELGELLAAELIDQVTPGAEYAFRHPLIHAVAYESQLKSDRAEAHRRLAAAIEAHEPESADQNAALIAEHLQAAGDQGAAYGWHMRAAAWATNRDIAAARISWERARQIADTLPGDYADRTAMRIAPRTMLCVSAWRAHANSFGDFDELRQLCALAGDKASLAIAMTGLATELLWCGRAREASRLASEQMALLESIGDSTLTVAAAYVAIVIKFVTGEIGDVSLWSQTVIDLAQGDPAKGASFGMGSPLAAALAYRGISRLLLGNPGWRRDIADAVAMARSSDPTTHSLVVATSYSLPIAMGALVADDAVVREFEEALRGAERSGGDTALHPAKAIFGGVLMHRDDPADRQRGLELVAPIRDMWLRERSRLYLVPIAGLAIARERVRRGDCDSAIPIMRQALDDLFKAGQLTHAVAAILLLVEALLDRGAEGDVAEAQEAIDRLANLLADHGWVVRDIWLTRLRALMARARDDEITYRVLVNRYRTMAESLGFEADIARAETMIEALG
jgi:hypothetical protein